MSSVTNSGRDMLSNQPLQPREIAGKVHFVFWEGLLENIFEWKWRLEHLLLGRERLPRRWELESCVGPPCWHWGLNMKNHWELRSDEERKLSGSWKNWCLDSASVDKTPRLFILWASVFLTQRNYSWGFLSLANKISLSDSSVDHHKDVGIRINCIIPLFTIWKPTCNLRNLGYVVEMYVKGFSE